MVQGPMSSILVTVRIQKSEVRNPHSLEYRKSYQRILMKFYGELGLRGLETNWLHFGDESPFRITIQIREELPRCQRTEQMPCKNHSASLLCWRSAEVCALWVLLVAYSKMCYFWTTKVEMIKFATIMANCIQNNLWKFR